MMKKITTKDVKVELVLLLVSFLTFLDFIGETVRKYSLNLGRIGSYMLVVSLILTSFFVSSKSLQLYKAVDSFTSSDEILGVAADNFGLPTVTNNLDLPYISARSVYAVDMKTGSVLLDINSEERLPPASTTKLMTALVALDVYDPEAFIKVSEFCTQVEGLKAGFYSGELFSLNEYLHSLLIFSAADAACSLSLGEIPYTDFLARMNKKADVLGMKSTTFTNTIGLDSANGDHLSTAKDLYRLGSNAMKNPQVREIVKQKEYQLVSPSGYDVTLYNTNDLLWSIPGSVGIKTGTTAGAGEVLIYEYQNNGTDIMIVVMGSQDRFGDTARILYWILDSYTFY